MLTILTKKQKIISSINFYYLLIPQHNNKITLTNHPNTKQLIQQL